MVMRNKQEIFSKDTSAEEKQKQLDELRAYNRQWYHEHKVPVECEWCKASFSNRSSVNRRLSTNQKCRIRCLEDQVEKLKAQLAEQQPVALTV